MQLLFGDFQSIGQFTLLVTTVDPQKKTEPRKQIHHTSPTMNIKDLLGATKKIYLNTGIQNYVKYLNPYYPARVLADKGKHEYGALYFMGWYALLGYLIARPKKQPEEKTEEKAQH